jgi:hypothetical protein
MSRQAWEECIAWATADGTAIQATTTEAIIFPNITIPANFMADGRVLRLKVYGRHGTTGTPTLTFAVRWGGVSGTIIAQSGALTCGSGITAAPWEMEVLIQVRSNGATGSVFCMGHVMCWDDAVGSTGSATNAPGIAALTSAGAATPAAVTVDLTADTALSVTADWSANSASNTLTGHIYTIECMN